MASAEPPPYTYNLDQSLTCPRNVIDAWYSKSASAGGGLRPVRANATSALANVIAAVPSKLEHLMATLRAPSAMVIAQQAGVTLFESYQGTARVGTSVPLTRDSGFMIASNSKVFTAVMLFALRDAGALPQGLDTPVASLMPGWVEPHTVYGEAGARSRRGLTLRSLATHASGLPRETPHGRTEEEILREVGNMRMLFPQYAATAYSNLGVSLLGRTLERATGGLRWEEWVETKIMRPLGMLHSGPCLRTAAEAASIVDGVDPTSGSLIRRHYSNSSRCPWGAPAGGVYSTAADMARWASFLAGTLPMAQVLDPSSILELRNTGMLQDDGISAVSGGTLESAFSHGRWTFNKLGCLDGYRSATTLCPLPRAVNVRRCRLHLRPLRRW